MVTPRVHLCLPLWEILRENLRQGILNGFWTITDWPEESPFSVEGLWVECHGLVHLWQSICDLFVISGLLHGLRGNTDLEAELGSGVCEVTTCIVVLADSLKVAFNHIDIAVIFFVSYAWVSNDTDSKFMEGVCDLAALLLPVRVCFSLEEGLHFNNRGLVIV